MSDLEHCHFTFTCGEANCSSWAKQTISLYSKELLTEGKHLSKSYLYFCSICHFYLLKRRIKRSWTPFLQLKADIQTSLNLYIIIYVAVSGINVSKVKTIQQATYF